MSGMTNQLTTVSREQEKWTRFQENYFQYRLFFSTLLIGLFIRLTIDRSDEIALLLSCLIKCTLRNDNSNREWQF